MAGGDFVVRLVLSAINQATGPLRQVAADVGRLENSHKAVLEQRAALRSQMLDVAGLGLALAAPIKAAIDFESAMADVKKVVDFPAPDGLAALRAELLGMTSYIPIAATGLAEIAAAGGQLGVAPAALKGFVETAAKMAVAFDMLPSQAGDAMAKLSNVFGIPIGEMERVGDAVNHLSNNSAAKASELVEVMLRTGGAGKMFGLAAQEVGALGSAFVALGKSPEVAATGINAMLTKLQNASLQGKDFQAVLRVMGLNARQLEKDIGQDAQGALLKVLESLEKLDPTKRAKALALMFGQEYGDDIAALVGNLDAYRKSLGLVADAQDYAGSMAGEFQARSETTANELQLMANAAEVTAINLGSFLLPTLVSIARVVRDATSTVAGLAERFPLLTTVVMHLVFGLVAMRIAALAGAYAMTLLRGGVLSARISIGRLSQEALLFPTRMQLWALSARQGSAAAVSALGRMLMPIRAVNGALMANPIGLVVMAIALAAALIYKYWSPISGFFRGLWTGIRQGLEPLGPAFEAFGAIAGPIFDLVAAPVRALIGLFSDLLTPVDDVGGAAEAMGARVGQSIAGLVNGAMDKISALMGWVRSQVDAITGFLPDWLVGWSSDEADAAAPVSSAGPSVVPSAVPAGGAHAQQIDAGGTIRVVVDSDGRARVAEMKTNDPRLDMQADMGLSLAVP